MNQAERLPPPRPLDLAVAAQIKVLQKCELQIHIPKRNPPYFTVKPMKRPR